MQFEFRPIGIIHTPFTDPVGMPIQPRFAQGAKGTIEIFEKYVEGLADVAGFSHLHLLYAFHRSEGYALTVKPFLDDQPRGLFATRAPRRPNPIGLSVVRLLGVDGATLTIEDVDVLDGTPLLDIKPFNPISDNRQSCAVGWMEGKATAENPPKSDERFSMDRS